MPAVAPAEHHARHLYGASERHPPPRPRTPPQASPFFPSACPPWFVFLRVLRVLCGLLFSVSSVSSVPSMSCPMWGRLSSRPWPPLPAALCSTQPPRLVGADQRVRPFSSNLSVLRVLCGLLFPRPPHPQSQPSPNLFPFPFQPLANSPFLLLLLLSCMLKVKGAADALVGARTADGASPGPRRRRPQPLPSLQPNLAECADQPFRPLSSHLRALRGLFFSVFSVFSVVCFFLRVLRALCGLPSPCSLWFAFFLRVLRALCTTSP